jgi:hypothetical protein
MKLKNFLVYNLIQHTLHNSLTTNNIMSNGSQYDNQSICHIRTYMMMPIDLHGLEKTPVWTFNPKQTQNSQFEKTKKKKTTYSKKA